MIANPWIFGQDRSREKSST